MNTARKREWNVIDILGGSPERFIEALDYPKEVLDALENCLKGEGVDVEELDFVDEKDKAAWQSCILSPLSMHSSKIHASGI